MLVDLVVAWCAGSTASTAVTSMVGTVTENLARVLCAGNIAVPGNKSANYTFFMDSDDGSQLYIDGQLLINHAGARKPAVLDPAGASACALTLNPALTATTLGPNVIPTLTLQLGLTVCPILLQASVASHDTAMGPHCLLRDPMPSSWITFR